MRKLEIDPAAVEDCAARGLSQWKAAEELGVKWPSFVNRIAARPSADLRGAWERGRRRLEEARRADELLGGIPEDEPRGLVLRAVFGGIKSRREIRAATGLPYWRINDVLCQLEAEGFVQKVETLNVDYYRRSGSDEQPPRELGNGGGTSRAASLA